MEFFHLVDELLYLSKFETQKVSIRVMPTIAIEAYDLTILEALEVDAPGLLVLYVYVHDPAKVV